MRFKFYQEKTVQRVREFKRKGMSAAEIGRRFKIADTTVLRWCNDIPSQNPYHLFAQIQRDNARARSRGLTNNIEFNKENAKILASILYWCEGSKYPSSNFVAFSNSDVNLVTTFLRLFRLGFRPEENKLKVSLQLHTTHNKEEITSFWSKILKIPKSRFYKPTITKPTKNMKRRDYRGTCTIRYYDVYVLLEMTGIFDEFSKRIFQKGGVG